MSIQMEFFEEKAPCINQRIDWMMYTCTANYVYCIVQEDWISAKRDGENYNREQGGRTIVHSARYMYNTCISII